MLRAEIGGNVLVTAGRTKGHKPPLIYAIEIINYLALNMAQTWCQLVWLSASW
jgi:hypothetical protein